MQVTVMTSFRSLYLERERALRESFIGHHVGLRDRLGRFAQGHVQ
jgi:hypothetical protein